MEEHGVTMMTFDNGMHYYWERAGHANVEVPDETRIYGTRGGMKFSYLSWEAPEIMVYGLINKDYELAENEVITVDFSRHEGDHFALICHFLEVLEGKAAPVISLETAARNMEILFRVYASVHQNS